MARIGVPVSSLGDRPKYQNTQKITKKAKNAQNQWKMAKILIFSYVTAIAPPPWPGGSKLVRPGRPPTPKNCYRDVFPL